MFKHIPNILTIIRFFIIPFIVYFSMQDNYITAIIFLIISGFTDIADGFIARKFNLISDFGKLMDPLADKCTQLATLIVLTIQGIVPILVLLILFIKEILLIIGASFLYGRDLVVSSRWFGKISTILFYVAIIFSMIIQVFNLPYTFDIYIYYLALLFTAFSLVMYFKVFFVKDYLKQSFNSNNSTKR